MTTPIEDSMREVLTEVEFDSWKFQAEWDEDSWDNPLVNNSCSNTICSTLRWDETNEGHEYWHNIARRLLDNEKSEAQEGN